MKRVLRVEEQRREERALFPVGAHDVEVIVVAVHLLGHAADALGILANVAHLVAPGPADTPRLRALSRQAAETRGVPVETVLAERAAESPLGRLVTPAEVAWAVATLLAPEAAALDGSALSLDVGARRGIF